MTDGMPPVYLDRLTLGAVLHVVRCRPRLRSVILLDDPRGSGRVWRRLLLLGGIRCEVAEFFAGHLRTADGESVYFAARRIANRAALTAAEQIVSGGFIGALNARFGRNTLQLFIARHLARHVEEWVSRILVVRGLSTGAHVLLRRPTRFNAGVLLEVAPDVSRTYHADPVREWWDLLKDVGLSLLRNMWRFTVVARPRGHGVVPPSQGALLVMQEDSVRNRGDLRNQLHFLERDMGHAAFETYVIMAPRDAQFDNDVPCAIPGVTTLPFETLGRARAEFRRHPCLRRVARERRWILARLWRAGSYAEFYFLVQTWSLLFQAQLWAGTFLKFGVKCLVSKEPHTRVGDAVQIIAPELGVSTVALQYSNLGFVAPVMMSTADTFVVFSDAYRAVFESHGIGPARFVANGYLYGGVERLVRERATAHRQRLEQRGAQFVIGYFDESVQHDRWGAVHMQDHLHELHALARLVVASGDVGVIVKSQFMRNSPSALYPTDPLLAEAMATGRYLEVRDGAHRNDVYPAEVALAADVCIGHKFGATATLEAASAGARTLLIDGHRVRTAWDSVYAQADVLFDDIDQALSAMRSYRSAPASRPSLGDWTLIRAVLDPPLEDDALVRTRRMIRRCLQGEKAS